MMREERILMMNDVELECRYICVYLSYPHFLANPPFLVFFQIGPYRYLIVFCYTCILLFPLNRFHSCLNIRQEEQDGRHCRTETSSAWCFCL